MGEAKNGNGKNGHYTTQQFIEAIPGSGGVISTIATRVKCGWHTADRWIKTRPTVRVAYQDELEKGLDQAESVVLGNINQAMRKHKQNKDEGILAQVDSTDAKWYLSRKGKGRGYIPASEITGPEGGPIPLDLTEWKKRTQPQLEPLEDAECGDTDT